MRPGFGLGFDGLGVPSVRVLLWCPYTADSSSSGYMLGRPSLNSPFLKIAVAISVLGGYEWHLGVDENI